MLFKQFSGTTDYSVLAKSHKVFGVHSWYIFVNLGMSEEMRKNESEVESYCITVLSISLC